MLFNNLFSLSPGHHAASYDLLLLSVIHQAVTMTEVWLIVYAERLYVVELLHDIDALLLFV